MHLDGAVRRDLQYRTCCHSLTLTIPHIEFHWIILDRYFLSYLSIHFIAVDPLPFEGECVFVQPLDYLIMDLVLQLDTSQPVSQPLNTYYPIHTIQCDAYDVLNLTICLLLRGDWIQCSAHSDHLTFHYAVTGVPAPTISKWSIEIGEFKFQIERGCPAFHSILTDLVSDEETPDRL